MSTAYIHMTVGIRKQQVYESIKSDADIQSVDFESVQNWHHDLCLPTRICVFAYAQKRNGTTEYNAKANLHVPQVWCCKGWPPFASHLFKPGEMNIFFYLRLVFRHMRAKRTIALVGIRDHRSAIQKQKQKARALCSRRQQA